MSSNVRQRAARIGRLTTVMEIAAEIGRVYRDARHEKIDAALGNRLASILSAMRQCLETAEFERRIADIEKAVAGRAATGSSAVDDFVDRNSDPDESDLPKSDRRH